MNHPFAPAATDADINGGTVGLYGGTSCFYYIPGTNSCIRINGSVNLSGINGTSPPNFGGEINKSRVGWFVNSNVEIVISVQEALHMLYPDHASAPQGRSFGPAAIFIAAGPALVGTKIDFAGDTTNSTKIAFNVQTGVIFPVNQNAAVRLSFLYLDAGNTSIPTAAGPAHVNIRTTAAMLGIEFHK
jgi:opacity protein-like surface antigen